MEGQPTLISLQAVMRNEYHGSKLADGTIYQWTNNRVVEISGLKRNNQLIIFKIQINIIFKIQINKKLWKGNAETCAFSI